jgi:hypothetical protein
VTLKVDGGTLNAKIQRAHGGHGVSVRLGDPNAGLKVKTIAVSFGDGTRGKGRKSLAHVYARAGTYQVFVQASDTLGNKVTARKLVSVR